ncbi:hypothetical protein GCM10028824_17800 [Hymenobacter segetis]|uniref:Uncharacterized protein n=1 Tax=Hymenobacter segetis TaxID=2025509 RepID=A0ABU9LZP3_9BACT
MGNWPPEEFWFDLSSATDGKYLCAEVYYAKFYICAIDTEIGEFSVSFHNHASVNYGLPDSITINLNEFIATLEEAKVELLKRYNGINDPL